MGTWLTAPPSDRRGSPNTTQDRGLVSMSMPTSLTPLGLGSSSMSVRAQRRADHPCGYLAVVTGPVKGHDPLRCPVTLPPDHTPPSPREAVGPGHPQPADVGPGGPWWALVH